MIPSLSWYLSISALGWLVFPLAYRLLPALPDRGYIFSRSLGWLLWAYTFWLLASLQVLPNTLGGVWAALLPLAGGTAWALSKSSPAEMVSWLRLHSRLVLFVEILFFLSFSAMALVRAANPEILGTEKPMELAFINAILSSPGFPPHDPWLSGHAISYYYFGYVMVAALARLTGVPGDIAFNLGVALVFALSALGAYGVVYSLLARLRASRGDSPRPAWRVYALLGPLFVLLVSNAEGFLELLHARGLFWKESAPGQLVSGFWRWLDMRELSQPPSQPVGWLPGRFLWWWRASRVVQDYDFAGNWKEVINEFPVFTFILSDLHPHVLAMPFAFLAMALALNVFYGGGSGSAGWLRRSLDRRTIAWIAVLLLLAGMGSLWVAANSLSLKVGALAAVCLLGGGVLLISQLPHLRQHGSQAFTQAGLGWLDVGVPLHLDRGYFVLSCVSLGGLAFLNTWDYPFYIALFATAYVLARRGQKSGRAFDEGEDQPGEVKTLSFFELAGDFIKLSLVVSISGFVLYLPFYMGFSSQAGGVLPNLVYPTRGAHLWVMFATLLLPLIFYLLYLWRSGEGELNWKGFGLAGGITLGLIAFTLVLTLVILLVPLASQAFLNSLTAPGGAELVREAFLRRLTSPGGWVTLFLLLGFILALLWGRKTASASSQHTRRTPSPHDYALLLITLGTLLVYVPEFIYLRDFFGYRINTIFKFYYQAWLIWGVAAAFGVAVVLESLRGAWGLIYRLGLAIVLAIGLTYTVLGFWTKTNGFKPPGGFSLDGTAYLERGSPDEFATIAWLREAPAGVVAEAVGGSYSAYGRVSMLSGKPTVLGWDFHEFQWRGGGDLLGSRQSDIQRLYCTNDWSEAEEIISQYDIRYVFIGRLERSTYNSDRCPGGLDEWKFQRNLALVFQQGEASIYAVP